MEKKRMPLQHKIIFGYIILVAVIGSMIAILIYERRQMREVEGSVARLWRMYEDIHIAHRHVTGLALQGEAAAGWSDAERDKYHTHRMRTDSMLGVLGLYNHTWRRNRHSASLSCRKRYNTRGDNGNS